MNEDLELLVEGEPAAPAPEWTVAWVASAHRLAVVRRGTDRELVVVEGGPSEWLVTIRGRRVAVSTRSHRDRLLAAAGSAGMTRHGPADVVAMLPGLVVRVLVAVDEVVAIGDPLVTIEAMKMQNEIRAPRAGRVSAVGVESGQVISAGALLVRLADPDP